MRSWISRLGRYPIGITLGCTLLLTFIAALIGAASHHSRNISSDIFPIFFLALTVILSLENVLLLFTKPDNGNRDRALKKLEPLGILFGGLFHGLFLFDTVVFQDWDTVIHEGESHTPLALDHLPIFLVFCLLGLIGYGILRYGNPTRLPPLVVVLSLSALYLGSVFFALLLHQCSAKMTATPLLWIYPFNTLIILLRLTIDTTLRFAQASDSADRYPKFAFLFKWLNLLPIWALLLAFPLLGLILIVLILFGQQPDSAIRLWTETADWTFSQMTPPPSIPMDSHYLCTVAAGGHPKLVKPLRIGKRHGHAVIVNRQLCIANAFEELLQERMPHFHRALRHFYDRYGYPIAKHIRTKLAADVVYLLMKPLEWCFLIALYLFDQSPENRIAIQYPHTPLPPEKHP